MLGSIGAIARPNVVALPDRRVRRQPGQILFRIGAAAAALAVVAGLGGVFNRVGGDNDGGTAFQTAASEIAGGSAESTARRGARATTTTAASLPRLRPRGRCWPAATPSRSKREIEDLIAQAQFPRRRPGLLRHSGRRHDRASPNAPIRSWIGRS